MNDRMGMSHPPRGVKICSAIRSEDSPREERIEYKGAGGCAALAYMPLLVIGFASARRILGGLNFQVESASWSAIFVCISVILVSCFLVFAMLMYVLTKNCLVASGGFGYYIDEFSLFNRVLYKKVWRFPLSKGTEVDVHYFCVNGAWRGEICVSNVKRRGFALNSVELSDGQIRIGGMFSRNDRVLNYFAEWIRQRVART